MPGTQWLSAMVTPFRELTSMPRMLSVTSNRDHLRYGHIAGVFAPSYNPVKFLAGALAGPFMIWRDSDYHAGLGSR